MADCVEALDRALADSASTPVQSFVGGVRAPRGKFHLKAALSGGDRPMFAAKINANYPENPASGRPTIQGVLILFDGSTGEPLLTMDSAALTAIRTAAATAVAVRHLASTDANALALVGCGAQAFPHVEAINIVRPLQRLTLYDVSPSSAAALRGEVERRLGIPAVVCDDLASCTRGASMVVTLTSSRAAFLGPEHVQRGAFVAGVGTDSPDKSELKPELLADAVLVVYDAAQCAEMGDLRHAIAAGAMTPAAVWATLAQVAAAPERYRPPAGTTVVFDSTGIPIEDVVAAGIVHRMASNS